MAKILEGSEIRVEVDSRNEKIGYKIREAQLEKVPYMLVLGDKEMENRTMAVRSRKGEQETLSIEDFANKIQEETAVKAKS